MPSVEKYLPCPKCGATDRVCEIDGGCPEPCIACGAPILNGVGHDEGCVLTDESRLVQCQYPEDQFEEGGEPPEGFDEWRTSEKCAHGYCIEVASYFREWKATRAPYIREEVEAMNADRELVLDETHGRGFE